LKKLSTMILITCIILSGSINANTQASETVTHEDLETLQLGLQVMPGCEKILLSWHEVHGAVEYNVFRDGTLFGRLADTLWIDTKAGHNNHTYQIEAINDDNQTIAYSWAIDGRTNCFDPNICDIELNYTLDSKRYRVNGVEKGPMDAPPVIIQGRMYLVVRYVTEEVGATLSWDGDEKKVTITTANGDIIELWIGRPMATVNGSSTAIDPDNYEVTPCIVNGRTLLPMRFVAEQLGATDPEDIVWNDETKTVTLRIMDVECPEPDIFCLTVLDTDSTKWLVKCVDSTRNHVDVLLNQEYCKYSASLERGELINVAGEASKENSYTYSIEARWIEPVTDETTITCFPSDCMEGQLTYIQDDEEKTLKYKLPFSEIESSSNNYAIKAVCDSETNEILWWEPLIYQQDKKSSTSFSRSVHVIKLDKQKNRILTRQEPDIHAPADWIYFDFSTEHLNSITESCYKVDYRVNYLGLMISDTSMELWDCPVPFNIIPKEGGTNFYPDYETYRSFFIHNKDSENHWFNVSMLIDDGKNVQEHKIDRLYVKSKKLLEVDCPFTTPSEASNFKIGVKVESNLTVKESWVEIVCKEFSFDLSVKRSDVRFYMNYPVTIDFEVKNIFDCDINALVSLELLNDSENILINQKKIIVPSSEAKRFLMPVTWQELKTNNKETDIIIKVESNGVVETRVIHSSFVDYLAPEIVISEIRNDENKKTVVFGDINWNELIGYKIIVHWGDGNTSDYSRFPLEHVYSEWGRYLISIEAHSKDGSVSFWESEYLCEKPLPPPPIIERVDIDSIMPANKTIRFTVYVNWGKCSVSDIYIDWGDGLESKSNFNEFRHTYEECGSYTMTIQAISYEDGVRSNPVVYSLYVGINFILYVRLR
jgi:hypothetical protein